MRFSNLIIENENKKINVPYLKPDNSVEAIFTNLLSYEIREMYTILADFVQNGSNSIEFESCTILKDEKKYRFIPNLNSVFYEENNNLMNESYYISSEELSHYIHLWQHHFLNSSRLLIEHGTNETINPNNVVWCFLALLNDKITSRLKYESNMTKFRFEYTLHQCSDFLLISIDVVKESLCDCFGENYETIINQYLYGIINIDDFIMAINNNYQLLKNNIHRIHIL